MTSNRNPAFSSAGNFAKLAAPRSSRDDLKGSFHSAAIRLTPDARPVLGGSLEDASRFVEVVAGIKHQLDP
jgi:hypothetical protein